MSRELSEADKRMTVESHLHGIIAGYGGEVIIAGPRMGRMLEEIVEQVYELARAGLLPVESSGSSSGGTT